MSALPVLLSAAGVSAQASNSLSVNPVTALQGQNITIVLTGQGTHWVNGRTKASAGAGITAGVVTVNSPTLAAVPVDLGSTATVGPHTITVTTGTETVTGTFQVTPGVPEIALISPNVVPPGQPATITVQGRFLRFQAGATVDLGPKVTVQSVTVTSPTVLTVAADVGADAPLYGSDVVVHSGGQNYRVPLGLTVAPHEVSGPNANYVYGSSPVPLNAQITVEFSKPILRSSLTATHVVMSDSRGSIPVGVVQDASGRFATVVPQRLLAAGGLVSVSLAGVTDVFGNALTSFSSSATTGYDVDQSSPSVTAVSPSDASTGVPTNAVISLRVSKPINPASAAGAIVVSGPSGVLPGKLSFDYQRLVVQFQPAFPLTAQTPYSVQYTAALEDNMGNGIANPGAYNFTTGSGPDTSFFYLVLTSPDLNAMDVPRNTRVRYRFIRALDPTSLSVTINGPDSRTIPAAAEVGFDPSTITVTPSAPLEPVTSYRINLGACSLTESCTQYEFSFMTGALTDTQAPVLALFSPSNRTSNVPVNARISFQMSERLDATSVADSMILFTPPVSGSLQMDSFTGTLNFFPAANLTPGTRYSVSIGGLRDFAGNVMAPTSAGAFTISDSGTPATEPVTLVSSSPANSATGVPLASPVILNFSARLSAALLSDTSVTASINGNNFAGTLTLTGPSQVTFTPIGRFPALASVVVSCYVIDLSGNVGSSSLTFTTAKTANPETPRVLSVSPPDGATDVRPGTPIVLTFSKSIDRTTLTGPRGLAAFAGQQLMGVDTVTAYDNRTVTLTPGSTPGTSNIISVVAGPGIKDLSGISIQTFQSSYTVSAAGDVYAPTVTIQVPASGSTVSGYTPTITLFTNKPMDGSTLAGAVSLVQGGIVIPAKVTLPQPQAIVVRPVTALLPDQTIRLYVSPDAMDATGMPFSGYSTTFQTPPNPAITPASLIQTSPTSSVSAPLDSVIDLQFSKALDPTTVTSGTVTLTRSGQAVEAAVELRAGLTTIRLRPTVTLAPGAAYSVSAVGIVDSNGLPVSAAGFTFYAGRKTAGPPPVLTGISPGGVRGVGTNTTIRVGFSRPINPTTATSSTVRLASQNGFIAPASIWFDSTNQNLTLTPSIVLQANAGMKIIVDGVEDLAAHKITAQSVVFTTGAGPDTVSPLIVSSTIPPFGQVPVNTEIAIRYNEAIDRRSVLAQSLLTDQSSETIPGTLSFSADGTAFTFTPAAPLQQGSGYSINLPNLKDLAGNKGGGSTMFYATNSPDLTPPILVASNPAAGSSGVPTNVRIEVLLSEPASLIDLSKVVLTQGSEVIPATVTSDPNIGPTALLATPSTLLKPGAGYTLTVDVSDTAGNAMIPQTVSFTTGALPQLQAAQLVAQNPPPFASNVPVNVQPYLTFDNPFNPISLASPTAVTIAQYFCGNPPVPATVSASPDGKTVKIAPVAPLSALSSYYLCVSATDVTGNAVNLQSFFTTEP